MEEVVIGLLKMTVALKEFGLMMSLNRGFIHPKIKK